MQNHQHNDIVGGFQQATQKHRKLTVHAVRVSSQASTTCAISDAPFAATELIIIQSEPRSTCPPSGGAPTGGFWG